MAASQSPFTCPSACAQTPRQHTGALSAATTLAGLEDSMASEEDLMGPLQDTESVEMSYRKAINGEPDGGHSDEGDSEKGEYEGEEDGEDQQDNEDVGGTGHNAATITANNDNMAWVDTYILNTRRNGGRLTETSVLKTYHVSDSF
jgi:hypothetical protein